jgi:hypothetical protein
VVRSRRRKGNGSGPAARDHDEAEAGAFIRKAAGILGLDARRANPEGRGRLLDEKAPLAWLVKKHTGVSNGWVSERLRIGHPTGVSKAVGRVTESPSLLRRARSLAKMVLPENAPE